ncbi:MAG: ParB/RepB/Spo0J family partition protein [Firmicutes bacterium]|nr:ParB/RepB/Spo0J family partition protein [Bacillota bacterium]
MNKPRGLGKGLGALIPELGEEEQQNTTEVALDLIHANPYQPRKDFSDEKLTELAESIKQHGIIQPLLVRAVNDQYQLIAGERRLRAAKLAGLTTVPVVIREMNDRTMMEVALVENIQREDLNPIEEANAYQRLINEYNLTQEEIAQHVGKSRSAIANTLRLLNLPATVQSDLSQGTLTMGHARPLLALKTEEEQTRVWAQIQEKRLSVRETEELVKNIINPLPPSQNESFALSRPDESKTNTHITSPNVSRETLKTGSKKASKTDVQDVDPNLKEIQEELQQTLGTKVVIRPIGEGGKIEIDYYSSEDLDRIYEKISYH